MSKVGLVVIVKSWLRDLWSLNGRRYLWSRKTSFALRIVVVIVMTNQGQRGCEEGAEAEAEEAHAAGSNAELAYKDGVGRCRA